MNRTQIMNQQSLVSHVDIFLDIIFRPQKVELEINGYKTRIILEGFSIRIEFNKIISVSMLCTFNHFKKRVQKRNIMVHEFHISNE